MAEKMADGVTPKEATEYLETVRAAVRRLEVATGALCIAYDQELMRVYPDYNLGPSRRPADGPEGLAHARRAFIEAEREVARVAERAW